METRIADLLAGLLLEAPTPSVRRSGIGRSLRPRCIAAQLHSIGLPHIQTCGIGASHVAR